LPVGLLVNDADTLEILHGNPPLPGFADHDLPHDQLIESHNDEHQPHLPANELAAVVEEVAATGRPRHLPEFRHDSPGQEQSWWSATLHRSDTDRWGLVVVVLAVDVTDRVRGRHLLEERDGGTWPCSRRSLPFLATTSSPPFSRLPMLSSPPYRPT
jgi:PAS domain-containing protein